MEAGTPSAQPSSAKPKPRPPRKPRPAPEATEAPAGGPSQSGPRPRGPPRDPAGPRNPRPQAQASNGTGDAPSASNNVAAGGQQARNPGENRSSRNSRYRKKPAAGAGEGPARETQDAAAAPAVNRRAAKFNAGLTDASAESGQPAASKPERSYTYKGATPKAGGLTATLIHALKTPPYSDCPICFAAIHPAQPTWSCSPSQGARVPDENGELGEEKETESAQCCWTTFHLKCIRSWAGKSVKEIVDAWKARGEDRNGEWRCPGCQTKRTHVPTAYWCFCGSTAVPTRSNLATPHSCANPCSRPRVCGHVCPLACHPGPCPPCLVTTELPCYCSKTSQLLTCSRLTPGATQPANLSCASVCGKKLGCGTHSCTEICHPGTCKPCEVKDDVRCYCGKTEKEVACGEGEEKACKVDGVEEWKGRFQCQNDCDRLFDCGIHSCSKPCHPPSPSPPTCPRSPSLISHCPCGKHTLDPGSRNSCADAIPTCPSTCMRRLEGCDHPCAVRCHTGSCPPCSIRLVRPCRCGATTRDILCAQFQQAESALGAHDEILCERACTALRACGKHQCNRICCPLASLAVNKKGKKRAAGNGSGVWDGVEGGAGMGGLHECDLPCGKMLGCGNHACEERDHRGACPPCLRSSFEEMICYCGQTVLDPPIPCGTRIYCSHPCSRPPLLCGHPKTQHSCHEDPAPCPACPFLTHKMCACGKKNMANVRCSQEKVSCGVPCGKLLGCGFHHCERLCHSDGCGPCASPCGKSRKLCHPAHHPCTLPCHAPAACSEAEPCRSAITLTCPCGRICQSALCGRSTSNPGRQATQQLKCSNECLVAKRNARLAEALGISTDASREKGVTYNDDVMVFARANGKFLGLVEKTFAEFVTAEKKQQVLPHMPADRRKFVHDLAGIYRMDVQMVDQEPHRSVQLIRRIDTRIPYPLLSSTIAAGAAPSLGKLGDLRGGLSSGSGSRPLSANPSRTSTPVGASRGWTSVVAKPAAAPANPVPAPSVQRTSWRPSPPRPQVSTPPPVAVAIQPPVAPEDVPDSWEDDV
ncbi:hypothetical protein FIBSPDRAFT_910249 [Athelia psychrophila]|uniref:R3H domain-containing protein n=1 Tax=Athelia psychrophila TaxID=1759441 RepID=A0A166M0Z8_9AGAM|nr:hypothetical protein FIBSPDRAFT_910249 [Fibularhizoctonia sp. CBS 109695]